MKKIDHCQDERARMLFAAAHPSKLVFFLFLTSVIGASVTLPVARVHAQTFPPTISPIDLVLKKSGSGTVSVGGQVAFTINPSNNGPGTIGSGGATVTDTLATNLSAITANGGPSWNCTVAGQTVTCTYVGSPIGPNQSLPPITIQATANTSGQLQNCARIIP